MGFTKRLTVPTKDDKGYILKAYGGTYLGIAGKPAYFTGSNMANCVGYAFARREEIEYELTGAKNTNVGVPKNRATHSPSSAYLWYGIEDGYEHNKYIPKEGSVVVWKHNKKTSGHVAIIEEIGKDYILISESGYNGYTFRTCKIYKNYCMITNYDPKTNKYITSKHWNYKYRNGQILKTDNTFLGYIYPPKEVVKPEPKVDEPKPEFQVGDNVILKSRNYKRTVIQVDMTRKKPYLIGTSSSKLTGWYRADQLEKQ